MTEPTAYWRGSNVCSAFGKWAIKNRHPIQVVAFTEEEGNVIGGTFGSKAFTGGEIDGAMRPNLVLHGLTMEEVNACRRDLTQYQCYLELTH